MYILTNTIISCQNAKSSLVFPIFIVCYLLLIVRPIDVFGIVFVLFFSVGIFTHCGTGKGHGYCGSGHAYNGCLSPVFGAFLLSDHCNGITSTAIPVGSVFLLACTNTVV